MANPQPDPNSMKDSHRSLIKRLTVVAGFAAMVGACSPQSGGVTDPAHTPSVTELDLKAQHMANLRVIAQYREKSAAIYDSLVAVWNARQDRGGPMTAESSSPFVPCQPLPFSGEAQIVGPAGGTFVFGPHTLEVPAGALSSSVSIGVMVQTSLKTEVTLLPHGTTFTAPVKLTLVYEHCDAASTHRVAYVDDLGNIVEWPGSTDYPTLSKVESSLSHFSTYAIAY
jgi:hypothetical protein